MAAPGIDRRVVWSRIFAGYENCLDAIPGLRALALCVVNATRQGRAWGSTLEFAIRRARHYQFGFVSRSEPRSPVRHRDFKRVEHQLHADGLGWLPVVENGGVFWQPGPDL